jgi:hypothetical protein
MSVETKREQNHLTAMTFPLTIGAVALKIFNYFLFIAAPQTNGTTG